MTYTLFVGCNIPVRVKQYELSARAVANEIGLAIEDNKEYKCCGYPIRNADSMTFIRMAARNLALAEQQGGNMIVLCKCCFGSLKKAAHLLKQRPLIQEHVNTMLAEEGLKYTGSVTVKHFLSVLYHETGIDALKQKITRPFKDLKIATHYGCHALRPSDIMEFDDPVAPSLFDKLVDATGAKSIEWSLNSECCGAPLLGVIDDLSMALTEKKVAYGVQAGADYLCVACPYCQMQFDAVRQKMQAEHDEKKCLSSMLYPQLLGLAMGLQVEALGIDMQMNDIRHIESFLA